ncbi:MAG: hypothetical protein GX428_06805 [Candidatus Atribacteria bacterium]|nr:hypothetical protein [Candidatus Atribacteria bacterium]
MSKKRIVAVIIIVLLLMFLIIGSGCEFLGFGVQVTTGIGKIFFDSADPLVYGEVYVDSIHIGYLKPFDRISTFVALDFDHEVWIRSNYGAEYRWKFRAPFTASQIIPLTLDTVIKP